MVLKSGIYFITNKLNGDRYIGSSKRMRGRWFLHRSNLRLGRHHSVHLQRAWDKYGENQFEFKTVLFCANENLLFYEQIMLDGLRRSYNISPTASSCLGRKMSEQSKLRMREAKKKMTDETKARMRQKMREAWVGRPTHSAESNERRRATLTGTDRSKNPGFVNRKHSEETKKKMSASRSAYWAKKKELATK